MSRSDGSPGSGMGPIAAGPGPAAWSPRPPLLRRRVLDAQMAWLRDYDPAPWGAWPWLGPLLTLVAVVVAGATIEPLAPEHGAGRAVVAVVVIGGGELLVVASLRLFAHRIVRRPGGWRVTLGLGWIADRDWQPWAIGLALLFGGRFVVNGAAAALTHGTAVKQAQNVQLQHPTVLGVVILSALLLVIAPLVEETLFRGVILRCFMRRLTFWPAALLSTAIFAVLHVYEVDTLAGRITLALNVGVLGLVNCVLVRVSGRLTPAIMLHATNNLIAFVVLLSQTT